MVEVEGDLVHPMNNYIMLVGMSRAIPTMIARMATNTSKMIAIVFQLMSHPPSAQHGTQPSARWCVRSVEAVHVHAVA
jgi:hypothetical protein